MNSSEIHRVEQAALTAVFMPSLFLEKMAGFFEVCNSAFDRAAGEFQLFGDGADGRITTSVPIGPIE